MSESQTLQSFAPATGRLLGSVPLTCPSTTVGMVATARAALAGWKKRPLGERVALLETTADILEREAEPLGKLLAEESGKILPQSNFEVKITVEFLRRIAQHARQMTPSRLPTEATPALAKDLITTKRVPYGVVLAVLPFNFPVELHIEKVAAALAMGNTVIVKAPPQTPLVVDRVTAAFHEAGVPATVLQIAHGGTDVGAALVGTPGLDLISLTGSTRAGVAVAQASASYLPRLHLELGGNDPLILLDDADLDQAVPQIIFGRSLMNGQACASNKRILVHRSLHDTLAERLKAAMEQIKIGDPLDPSTQLGPMIDKASAQRIVAQVQEAIDQGAVLLSGKLETKGAFIAPILLGNVPSVAEIAADEEIFGPVLPLIPFDTDAEAIVVANQSCYGLSSGVFSRNWERATAVADALEAGGTVVNGTGNYRPYIVPFGGVKMSGLGREGLGYTLEEMSQLKYTAWRNFLP